VGWEEGAAGDGERDGGGAGSVRAVGVIGGPAPVRIAGV
jgi:hypothetical protein